MLTLVTLQSCAQINLKNLEQQAEREINTLTNGGNSLSNDDIIKGLKEALNVGTNNSTGRASALDGFYKNPLIKIPFPPEAQKVKNTVENLGLKPQVETLLGGSMQQMFNTTTDPSTGQLNITGVKPFQPYSTDPSQYVAGFSPLQQQSFQGTSNLQMPGQYATGTGLATQAGVLSGLAGQQYAQQATSPQSLQAYMSPYMQDVVARQQQNAVEQAGTAMGGLNAKAAQMGAFGGSGVALQRDAANRDLQKQLGDIQATGLQKIGRAHV